MDQQNKNIIESLKDLWDRQQPVTGTPEAEASWSQFAKSVGIGHQAKIRRMQIVYYAAAILALIIAIGSFIHNQVEIDYLIVENPGDEYKQVILPDSSVVAIQPGTTLYYAKNFSSNRSVRLKGEGFFQVQKSKDLPFTVSCYKTLTTVLGTSFNIKSDFKENVSIALYEGSIKASIEDVDHDWLLIPGEQLVYGDDLGVRVETFNKFFNPLETNFDLENVSLNEVIIYVKEIYGYDIVIDKEYLKHSITLRINKNDSLHNIISVISTIYKLKPEINENMKQITLSK